MRKVHRTFSRLKFKLRTKEVVLKEDLVADNKKQNGKTMKRSQSVRISLSDPLNKEIQNVNLENPCSKENTYPYFTLDTVSPTLTANRRFSMPPNLPQKNFMHSSVSTEDASFADVFKRHENVMTNLRTIIQESTELEKKLTNVKLYPRLQVTNVELDLATESVHVMKRLHEIAR
nr:hypothetical protein HmN_000555500 [Hymenolepis microstoma]